MNIIYRQGTPKALKAIQKPFIENPYALRLYDKCGYRNAGTVLWRKGEFYLMEKRL